MEGSHALSFLEQRADEKSLLGNGGMIMTGESRITRRETTTNATLSTTNLKGLTWHRTRASTEDLIKYGDIIFKDSVPTAQ